MMERKSRFLSAVPPLYRRLLKYVAQGAVLFASIVYLASNIRPLLEQGWVFEWRWSFFLASWGLTFLAVWLGAIGWWFVLRAVSLSDFTLVRAAEIHLKANLAKYLPGYAWQLVGKAYLSRTRAIPARVLSWAMSLELVAIMGTGVALAGATTFFIVLPSSYTALLNTVRIIAGVAFFALGVLPFLWRRNATRFTLPLLDTRYYLLALGAMALGWLCFGVGFWALAATVQPIGWKTFPTFLFTIVGAFSISLAVLFVPGGIGVRESVMTFLLSPLLGSSTAVMVATLSRVLLIISECLGVVSLIPWARKKIK